MQGDRNPSGPSKHVSGSKGRYQKRQRRQQKTVELLPDPEVLESYNYVIEGSAERILQMFENEQKHRQQWEDQALKVHALNSILGQILGFVIMSTALAASIYFGKHGDYTMAVFLGVFSFSSLVWAYIRTVNRRPLGKKFDPRTPKKEQDSVPEAR